MHDALRAFAAAAAAALCFSAFPVTMAEAAPLASHDDVQAMLDAYVAAHPHAAIVAGVIDGTTTQAYAALGKEAPVRHIDDRTRFQIGSVTKTFTATLLAEMVLAHEVALDDPIQRYLPPGVTAPSYGGTPITLGALAEQRSGLPPLPANLTAPDPSNPYAGYSEAQLYDALSATKLTRAPGTQYEYSNFGFMLLGQLLANRAHGTYADLMQTRILGPLGLNDTVVTGTPANRAQLVGGYTSDGTPVPPWDQGTLGGAGSIESDLHDVLAYVGANLAAPAGPLGPALAFAQQPREPIGQDDVRIGLAWTTNPNSGITFHNGQTGGYHAFAGFDKATHQAVVVLANVADMTIDQIAVHIFAPTVVPAPTYAAAQSEPSPYAGVYRLLPTFALTIFKRGGELYVQGTGQPALPLALVSGHTYAVQGIDAQITFDVDANGVAKGLTLHQNGIDQHANRAP
jgi:CubicO group peptidase (beta-lactamase class C family)